MPVSLGPEDERRGSLGNWGAWQDLRHRPLVPGEPWVCKTPRGLTGLIFQFITHRSSVPSPFSPTQLLIDKGRLTQADTVSEQRSASGHLTRVWGVRAEDASGCGPQEAETPVCRAGHFHAVMVAPGHLKDRAQAAFLASAESLEDRAE